MKIIPTSLPGVVIFEPTVFTDSRGSFHECFRESTMEDAGLPGRFVQDSQSCSVPGTIRGLHYQNRRPQSKLVRIVRGSVIDVAVDIRRGSPTFAQWVAIELSERNRRQVFIPAGFAHGFCVPEVESEMHYRCTAYYDPTDQCGVIWSDSRLGIPWPVREPILSARDRLYLPLDADRDDLPAYVPPGGPAGPHE